MHSQLVETCVCVCVCEKEKISGMSGCKHTLQNKHTLPAHVVCVCVCAGILGALVPCCLDLSLAHQYGECLCIPLLPGSTFAIRVGIRERYKIRVSRCRRYLHAGEDVLVNRKRSSGKTSSSILPSSNLRPATHNGIIF